MGNFEQVTVNGLTEVVEFFDPQSEGRRGARYAFKLVWAGNHSKCRHGANPGICVTPRGWHVDGESWRVVPRKKRMNMEPNAMAMVEFAPAAKRFPEPLYKYKGNVEWDASCETVRASDAVLRYHIDKNVKGLDVDLKRQKADYGVRKKETAERRQLLETANGLAGAKAVKPTEPETRRKTSREPAQDT